MQKGDVDDSRINEFGIRKRTNFSCIKPEVLNLKTEINADVHILDSNQHKISDISVIHKGSNMRTHFNAASKGLKPYQCRLCDYSATQAHVLKTHVDTIHKELKPYQCKLCDYTATQAGNLRRHVDAIHKGLKS